MKPGPGPRPRVPHVRGLLVLNTVRFIREEFGGAAHERVVSAMPSQHWGTFLGPLRDASFEPFEDLVAYMEAAKSVLAPGEPDFFRRMGAYSGRLAREGGGLLPMVRDPETAIRMAPLIWSFLYDTGRLEVVTRETGKAVGRIHGFPARPSYCERLCGAWDELVGGGFVARAIVGGRLRCKGGAVLRDARGLGVTPVPMFDNAAYLR